MDASCRPLIEALHAGPFAYVVVLTGGGVGAAAQLLAVPGGSRTVLEVVVPYHTRALTEFLGWAPEHCCSSETAAALAERARDRARPLISEDSVAGVACTAALATDRPKKGDHRVYVAVATGDGTLVHTLTFHKGARDRTGEETVVAGLLLNAMAQGFGTAGRIDLDLLPDEIVEAAAFPSFSTVDRWRSGANPPLCLAVDGCVLRAAAVPPVLLPGSFNPLHAGHRGMAEAAARETGQPVAFELSVTNADKPPLTEGELHRRIRQFTWKAPLWLSRAPTFAEKAALFPGTTFVLGTDTALRVLEPRYYQGGEAGMLKALAAIRNLGCRFLVAGRVDAAGRYLHCGHLAVSAEFREMFAEIPEAEFRLDVSSTQLRAASSG